MSRKPILRPLRWLSTLVVPLVLLLACRGEANSPRLAANDDSAVALSAPSVAPEPGTRLAPEGPAADARKQPAGGARLAIASPAPKDDDAEGEDDEKDYWDEVSFGERQFKEVLAYVEDFYIDRDVDTGRAYSEAANVALLEALEDVPRELLPEAFLKARKGHADEEGGLDGRTYKLAPDDAFLVHVRPKDDPAKEKKKKKRLDDDELREAKRKSKERAQLLSAEWKKIPFVRKDFDRVIAHIREFEKEHPAIKLNRVWIAAAQGYLFALDPHSTLVNRKAWDESVRETEDGSFDGIGAILVKRGEDILIESPIEGQPAHKVGLRAGDTIIRVDDVDVTGMELVKVVKMIRGPRGTNVKLTIRRLSEPEDLPVVITRAHIEIPNVQGRLLPSAQHPDIAAIKVTGFVDSTPMRLEEEIARLARETTTGSLRGIVLDMRNNPGGLLDAAIAMSDLFLDKGRIVTVKNSFKASLFSLKRDETHEATADSTLDLPMVVLVNEGSASASEIVASALQENHRALVVGRRTFGKASVQTLMSPKKGEGYYVKLTVSRYYGPRGKTLQAVGVVPDFEVPEEPGEELPVGFREEDLSHHLSRIDEGDGSEVNRELAGRVTPCLARRGIAERLYKKNPNPEIKFDYELFVAADVLECAADPKVGQAASPMAEKP